MATATRWTIRQEPYDPDARDADGDGVVQEQTPWERPAGTRLVDDLGRAITRGANAGQRPRGLRVVDQSGNPVAYTPTYEKPGAGFGAGGGTSMSEAGAPSLRELGLQSVRDIAAPKAPPDLSIFDFTPEGPSQYRGDGTGVIGRIGLNAGSKQAIEAKNVEILAGIEEAGGSFARVTEGPGSAESVAKSRREKMARELDSLKESLRNGEAPEKIYIGDNGLDPELLDLILSTDTDELIRMIEDSAVKYHQGLSGPRVRMREEFLDGFLADGRYKTTHETWSRNAKADGRRLYEEQIGIPSSAGVELRPASGFVVHEDAIKEMERVWEESQGVPASEYIDLGLAHNWITDRRESQTSLDGMGDSYGWIELVLDPSVTGRTAQGGVDTISNSTNVARMDSEDRDEIANAVLGRSNAWSNDFTGTMLSHLEAERTGSLAHVTDAVGGWRAEKGKGQYNYQEALIAGSFDLSEVADVRLLPPTRNPEGLETSLDPVLGFENGAALKADIHEQFYSPEALKKAGLTDEEIAYLQENDLLNLEGRLADHIGGRTVMSVLEGRKAQELEDKLKAAGAQKVTHVHLSGKDMMDPASFGDDAQLGDTAAAIREARAQRDITAGAREAIEKHKASAPKPEKPEAPDEPDTPTGGMTGDQIKAKNEAILGQLEQSGSSFGRIDDEYKKAQEQAVAEGRVNSLHVPKTREEAIEVRKETTSATITAVRAYLETGELTPWNGRVGISESDAEVLDNMPQALRELILTSTDDELNDMILSQATRMQEEVKAGRIRVNVTDVRLGNVVEDGEYKTVFSGALTENARVAGREQIDARIMGIPSDVAPELHPASGYAITREQGQAVQGDGDVEDIELASKLTGIGGVYGDVVFELKPEVADRTSWSLGDSMNAKGPGVVRMDEDDPEYIAAVLINGSGTKKPQNVVLNMLESERNETTLTASVKSKHREIPAGDSPESASGYDYLETNIAGSFNLDEVDSIRVPSIENLKRSAVPVASDADDLIEGRFMDREKLEAAGMTEGQIAYILELKESDPKAYREYLQDQTLQSIVYAEQVDKFGKSLSEKHGVRLLIGNEGRSPEQEVEKQLEKVKPFYDSLGRDADRAIASRDEDARRSAAGLPSLAEEQRLAREAEDARIAAGGGLDVGGMG